MTRDYSPLRAIRVMTEYLSDGVLGRHAELIRTELSDLIAGIEIDDRIARAILAFGDPDLIRQVIDHPRAVDLTALTDFENDSMDVLDAISFDDIATEHRAATLDLLRPLSREEDLPLASKLVGQAVRAGDGAFLRHVLTRFPTVDRHVLLLAPHVTRKLSGEAGEIWSEVFADIDLDRPEVHSFARDAVRTQNVHGAALLLRAGYRLRPVLEANRLSGNPWPIRLLKRMQSSHGEIAVYADLPSFEEIASMDEKALQRRLAGPSPKEEKAARKAEKNKRKREDYLAYKAGLAAQDSDSSAP